MARRTPFERDFADLHGDEIDLEEVSPSPTTGLPRWRMMQAPRRGEPWYIQLVGWLVVTLLSGVFLGLCAALLGALWVFYLIAKYILFG